MIGTRMSCSARSIVRGRTRSSSRQQSSAVVSSRQQSSAVVSSRQQSSAVVSSRQQSRNSVPSALRSILKWLLVSRVAPWPQRCRAGERSRSGRSRGSRTIRRRSGASRGTSTKHGPGGGSTIRPAAPCPPKWLDPDAIRTVVAAALCRSPMSARAGRCREPSGACRGRSAPIARRSASTWL